MTDATQTIVDSVAQVCAGAIAGYVFAAGVDTDVVTQQPMVVPVADDFTEQNTPFVTVAWGPWAPQLLPGHERTRVTLLCAVWRGRVPLGSNHAALLADRAKIVDAFLAHGRLFLNVPDVQSAILTGGPGIVPRTIPRVSTVGSLDSSRIFLTLPFQVDVVIQRVVTAAPA